MIPDSYRKPVRPTPRIEVGATVGLLGSALDGQTSSLDQANGRTADVISMADSCHAHQDAVLKALTPARHWWRFW